MVFGATTFGLFVRMLPTIGDDERDAWMDRMLGCPTTAGLVDRIKITVFPVIAAQTGDEPVFAGAGDFDLDLLETRTLDGRTQELVYRPTLRTWPAG